MCDFGEQAPSASRAYLFFPTVLTAKFCAKSLVRVIFNEVLEIRL